MKNIINNGKMDGAATAASWAFLAAGAAALVYTLTANPQVFPNYFAAFAAFITATAVHPVLRLARHATARPEKRGPMPFRDSSMALLATASYFLLLTESEVAVYLCFALLITAAAMTLADNFRSIGNKINR